MDRGNAPSADMVIVALRDDGSEFTEAVMNNVVFPEPERAFVFSQLWPEIAFHWPPVVITTCAELPSAAGRVNAAGETSRGTMAEI